MERQGSGGGEPKIISAILEKAVIERYPKHLGPPAQAPSPDTNGPLDWLCLAMGRAPMARRDLRGHAATCSGLSVRGSSELMSSLATQIEP
jgi:hypothetical protein